MSDLAQRAMASKHWRRPPGEFETMALYTFPGGGVAVPDFEACEWYWRGWLLELVRERWGHRAKHEVSVEPYGDGWAVIQRTVGTGLSGLSDIRSRKGTELECLVAALVAP